MKTGGSSNINNSMFFYHRPVRIILKIGDYGPIKMRRLSSRLETTRNSTFLKLIYQFIDERIIDFRAKSKRRRKIVKDFGKEFYLTKKGEIIRNHLLEIIRLTNYKEKKEENEADRL